MAYKLPYTGEELKLRLKSPQPRNLLDNSNFINPVNQRGATSYTGDYGIDRWRVWNNDTITVSFGEGIVVSGVLYQYLPVANLPDALCTLAICDFNGNIEVYVKNPHNNFEYNANGLGMGIDATYDTTKFVCGIGGSKSLKWAALYEGEYTVETLPEYQSKGYGVELKECQRYYYQTPPNGIPYPGLITNSGTHAYIAFWHPNMRTKPSLVSPIPTMTIRTISGYSSVANNTSPYGTPSAQTLPYRNTQEGFDAIYYTFDSTIGTNNTPIAITLRSNSYIALSAEL